MTQHRKPARPHPQAGRFVCGAFHSSDFRGRNEPRYHGCEMAFPIKTCIICSEEFELRPDKPGFANRCPECSTPEAMEESGDKHHLSAEELKAEAEMNEARRRTIRDMLYRNES
jgi:hypothetical protein